MLETDLATNPQAPGDHAPEAGAGAGRLSSVAGGAANSLTNPGNVPPDLANHPKFEILQLLGKGGMGAVYKARHKVMNRLVALKIINAELVKNANSVERFHREVRAAAKLQHANIVTAYDADQAGSTHFLVMEYVEGTDLAKYVQAKGPLPVAHACHFIRQAALGLQHAHEAAMVHRDIKPHNLMLTAGGLVKIMDFGLARLPREGATQASLTGENVLMGTADYIAPEQATHAHAADIRADIYGLGCTLFHLLAGRPPFAGATPVQKIAAHLMSSPPLHELPATTPPDLRSVLAKMLEKDPAQRYQTPAEVAAALSAFVRKPQAAKKPGPAPAAPSPAPILSPALPVATPVMPASAQANRTEILARRPQGALGVRKAVLGSAAAIVAAGLLFLAFKSFFRSSGPGDEDLTVVQKDLEKLALPGRPLPKTRKQLLAFHREFLGTGHGVQAAKLLSQLKWAADSLQREGVSPNELRIAGDGDKAPPGLVAVLGDGRMKDWYGMHHHAIALHPDGKILATGTQKAVRLWELDTGRLLHVIPTDLAFCFGVPLAFSPDGRWLAFSPHNGAGQLWDLKDEKLGRKFPCDNNGWTSGAAFSPDSKLVAFGGFAHPNHIWNVETGEKVADLEGNGIGTKVAFTRNGKYFLSCGENTYVHIWEVSKWTELRKVEEKAKVFWMALSADSQVVALSGEWVGVKIRDIATGELKSTIADFRGGGAMVAFGEERVLAMETQTPGSLNLVDAATDKVFARLSVPRPGNEWIASAFSKDGKTLATFDYAVRLWDAPDWKERRWPGRHTSVVFGVACSPDGQFLASCSADQTTMLWDMASGQPRGALEGHEGGVRSVAFSPDGKTIVTCGDDKTVRVWDAAARKVIHTYAEHTARVNALAVSPDGETILSAGDDKLASFWNPKDGRRRSLGGHTAAIHAAAFAPDGKLAATAGDDSVIRLWNVATGEELPGLKGHTKSVRALAFSADASTLASGDAEGVLRLWDMGKRWQRQTIHEHKRAILSVAFSARGEELATSSEDGTVRIWDPDGNARQTLTLAPRNNGQVQQVIFTPDSRHVVTANGNGTVYILRVAPGPPAPAPERKP